MPSSTNISINRRAYYDYSILDKIEAGIALTGTEIKSIRLGKVDLRGSYVKSSSGELWVFGMHIALYESGGISNHDPQRPKKLLLHKSEIIQISGDLSQKGLTLIPLRIYVKKHVAKLELGLARGKRKYDKRRTIIDRDKEREAGRAMRRMI